MDGKKHLDTQAVKTKTGSARGKARQRAWVKILQTLLIAVLIICAWAGLIYWGYDYATRHLRETEDFFTGQIEDLMLANKQVEDRITAMLQKFQLELESSHAEMEQIRSELQLIQDELALTGETITGTDQTRLSLQARINELDRQLAGLREQLKKLEEAVRAF